MKPVFKCDYCSHMGTEEEIKEHEITCIYNYDRKSCYTCTHKKYASKGFECKNGITLPEGKIYEFCDSYERKEHPNDFSGIFGDILFGGF